MNQPVSKATIAAVSGKVYRRFPEMKGVRPRVRLRQNLIRLVYTTEINLGGEALKRVVRVLATRQGKILKITTTR